MREHLAGMLSAQGVVVGLRQAIGASAVLLDARQCLYARVVSDELGVLQGGWWVAGS